VGSAGVEARYVCADYRFCVCTTKGKTMFWGLWQFVFVESIWIVIVQPLFFIVRY
jgi:hypothetical protein